MPPPPPPPPRNKQTKKILKTIHRFPETMCLFDYENMSAMALTCTKTLSCRGRSGWPNFSKLNAAIKRKWKPLTSENDPMWPNSSLDRRWFNIAPLWWICHARPHWWIAPKHWSWCVHRQPTVGQCVDSARNSFLSWDGHLDWLDYRLQISRPLCWKCGYILFRGLSIHYTWT